MFKLPYSKFLEQTKQSLDSGTVRNHPHFLAQEHTKVPEGARGKAQLFWVEHGLSAKARN